MPIEHQLVQSLVKPAMMDIPTPFLIFDGGYEGVPITMTRASTKLLMGPAGVFYIVPINVQPHEWEIGGAYIGRRYEEERTWRLLHNRDWTDAVFDTVTNITAAKDATGLDGVANSASTLTATAANGVIRQSITLASAERTSSFNVKRKTGIGDIDITDDGGSNYTTLTGLSSSVWTRHTITRTQANPDVGFRIVTSGDEIEVDFGGVEEGAFATSEVEVGATAVVRAPDVVDITDLTGIIAGAVSDGTLYVEARFIDNTAADAHVSVELGDGTNDERYTLKLFNGGMFGEIRDGGSTVTSMEQTASGENTPFKSVLAWALNDAAHSTDGGITKDNTVTLPTVDRLLVGRTFNGTDYLNGPINSILSWLDRRPDIEVRAIAA